MNGCLTAQVLPAANGNIDIERVKLDSAGLATRSFGGQNRGSRAAERVEYDLAAMAASLMARMKELDEENKRLKRMYAEKSMQNDLLKEALGKKW